MILNVKLVLTMLKLCSAVSRDVLQANYDTLHTHKVLKLKKLVWGHSALSMVCLLPYLQRDAKLACSRTDAYSTMQMSNCP